MHNRMCVIMHLLVSYQHFIANFIQYHYQYIGVFQDRSTASSLCVGLPSLQYM